MVLKRLSEAGGRGAGGFVGGIANNPGIILILVALGGLFIFRDKISEGFSSIGQGIADFELPGISLPDITFPSFEFDFPEITFPDFNIDFGDPLGDISKGFEMFAEEQASNFDNFVKGVQDFFNIGGSQDVDLPPDVPNTGLLSQEDILNCQCGTSIIQDSMGDVQQVCIPCEMKEDVFVEGPPASGGIGVSDSIVLTVDKGDETTQQTESVFQGIMDKVISMLPTSQEFFGGGPSFVGGSVFENPIDTFSEVLKFFPGLSASQAADFLEETGGKILPSQVEFVDPDIKNIVANIEGENIQVDFTSPGDLQNEAIIAACTSCQLFNLNCEQCRGGMA